MAINFPSNPTNSQEITEGNVTYVYNATKGYWESSEGSSSGASTTVYADMAALIAATGMSNGDQAFVTGNNNLYIYSGSGWYKVATVQQDAPSAITGVSGTYELAVDGTATTITAVSTDPEGFPLTWSYSTSGLGSIATVSQSDNVFTITPSTTVSDVGTFSLTINATDGVNGAVSTTTNLTLEFIIIVTNSKYTTLLATAVDTSDNNNITDSSSNNHSITVNGDAHAGTFSPYRAGGYSMYFDGGDYVDLGTGNLAINTEDFTIETWVNVTIGSGMTIANNSNWSAGDNIGWRAFITATGKINLTASQGSWNSYPSIYASTNTIPSNEWAHIVICRDSGVISSYINGIKDPTTVNYSASLNQTGGSSLSSYSLIGAYIADGNEFNNLTGYLSDFHFKLGSAKYTTTFSPPTERLTVESGTDVLLFNKPFLKDESTNAYTTSISGDPKIKPFSPYDYVEYSATDHGGSLHFNGTNSAVEIADNDDFDFGTGDFTIECWVYPEVTGNNFPGFLGTTAGWGSVAASGFRFDNLADSKFQMSWYGPGDPFLETQSTYLHDQWYHFVVTRTGGNTWRMFINGILEDVATNSTPYDICVGGHNLQVGGKTWDGGNGWFKGNVADLRLTKGSIVTEYQTSSAAIGTRIFTPRTTPITSSGSELHIKGTDASIIDKSQGSNLNLVGNTTGSTTQVKFADTKSMYFDGTSDYIITTQQELGTGDFTIEGWHYLLTRANTRNGIWGNYTSYTAGSLGMFAGHSSGTTTSYQVAYNGAAFPASVIQGGTIVYNQWVHFAVVRNSGTMSLYIDGTSVDSISATASLNGVGSNFIVGAPGDNLANGIHGYLQDLRITKGLARYTANFTPPTASLEG